MYATRHNRAHQQPIMLFIHVACNTSQTEPMRSLPSGWLLTIAHAPAVKAHYGGSR